MMERSTVNSLLRCTQAYCNQLCDKHTLDFGIVYYCERFPRVAQLNQFREVIAESSEEVLAAVAEADACFSQCGLQCHRWAPALGRASASLSARLGELGFERRVERALRLTEWPTWDVPQGVRVLPARAMRAAYQETLDAAPSFREDACSEDVAKVASERLDDPSFDMFVALVHDKPAGRCALYQVGDLAQVRDLTVLPEFENAGVERALLKQVLAMAKRLTIRHVLASVPVIDTIRSDWFQQAGFVMDGEIEEYGRTAPVESNPSE